MICVSRSYPQKRSHPSRKPEQSWKSLVLLFNLLSTRSNINSSDEAAIGVCNLHYRRLRRSERNRRVGTGWGFVAEIEQSEGKKEVEFVFYRVLTEVLDDKVNCGFGFAPVKVEKPTYRGEPLNEIEKTGIPTYVARGPIDTNEPIIAFESDGVGYIQDPSSVERTGSRMRVKMRRIPPK